MMYGDECNKWWKNEVGEDVYNKYCTVLYL